MEKYMFSTFNLLNYFLKISVFIPTLMYAHEQNKNKSGTDNLRTKIEVKINDRMGNERKR